MKWFVLMIFKCLVVGLLGSSLLSADEPVDGHFSSWEEVPDMIDSLTTKSYRKPFDELYKLTRITFGAPQVSLCLNEEEHQFYLMQTKEAWKKWWSMTGKSVAELKKRGAKVDEKAFKMAMGFLELRDSEKPKKLLPVWIPKQWTLCVSFTNGDYGREQEVWVVDRQEKKVSFTKLRGKWGVSLERYDGFTLAQADEMLKALCYVHQYASSSAKPNLLEGLYYPYARISLRDKQHGVIWNAQGYDFNKSRSEYGEDEAGRSYYFLRSVFGDKKKWVEMKDPSSEIMAPYRDLLSLSKPYFYSNASDIVQLFGERGKKLELKAMMEWAQKQKLAIDPNMDWKVCCDSFGTGSKVNVKNFTRTEFEATVKEIEKAEKRLGIKLSQELEADMGEMLALKKKEEEADIMRHPQPLRDLVRVDRHPNDPDLKHLQAAVTAIRKNPDPKLFPQLIAEFDDGTLEMLSLLKHVLLDERGLLGVPEWGEKELDLAVHACVDALPIAKKNGELSDLVEVLLHVYGGGEIEFDDGGGGRKLSMRLEKNGYSTTHGGAENPLSIEDAQKELLRLYQLSKKK